MNYFHEIEAQDCKVISYHEGSIRIKHPEFPRPRYFTKSRIGNWCWIKRYNHGGYSAKEIWIVKGDLELEAKKQGIEKTSLSWDER